MSLESFFKKYGKTNCKKQIKTLDHVGRVKKNLEKEFTKFYIKLEQDLKNSILILKKLSNLSSSGLLINSSSIRNYKKN